MIYENVFDMSAGHWEDVKRKNFVIPKVVIEGSLGENVEIDEKGNLKWRYLLLFYLYLYINSEGKVLEDKTITTSKRKIARWLGFKSRSCEKNINLVLKWLSDKGAITFKDNKLEDLTFCSNMSLVLHPSLFSTQWDCKNYNHYTSRYIWLSQSDIDKLILTQRKECSFKNNKCDYTFRDLLNVCCYIMSNFKSCGYEIFGVLITINHLYKIFCIDRATMIQIARALGESKVVSREKYSSMFNGHTYTFGYVWANNDESLKEIMWQIDEARENYRYVKDFQRDYMSNIEIYHMIKDSGKLENNKDDEDGNIYSYNTQQVILGKQIYNYLKRTFGEEIVPNKQTIFATDISRMKRFKYKPLKPEEDFYTLLDNELVNEYGEVVNRVTYEKKWRIRVCCYTLSGFCKICDYYLIRKRKSKVTDEDIVSYYKTMTEFVAEYFGKTKENGEFLNNHLTQTRKDFAKLEKKKAKQEEKKLEEELKEIGWD